MVCLKNIFVSFRLFVGASDLSPVSIRSIDAFRMENLLALFLCLGGSYGKLFINFQHLARIIRV